MYSFGDIINTIYYKIIINEFKLIGNVYSILESQKVNNCKNIINILQDFRKFKWCDYSLIDNKLKIKANKEMSKLITVKGIGEKTIQKIIEIIENKKLYSTEKLIDSDYYKGIVELTSVKSIGILTAKKLLADNVKTIQELKQYNGNILSRLQLKYIDILDKINNRIDRNTVETIKERLLKFKDSEIHFLGSYIRNENICSDIDILLISDNIDIKKKFVEFIKSEYKTINITEGDMKSSLYIMHNKNYIHLDVMNAPIKSRTESILYLTGPKEFNIWIRKIAKSKGFKLNEHELVFNRKRIGVDDEVKLFKVLGVEYIEPKKRSLFKEFHQSL